MEQVFDNKKVKVKVKVNKNESKSECVINWPQPNFTLSENTGAVWQRLE